MSQQPAEENEMDQHETENGARLIAICDLEPIPADVLERIRRRVQLAHASRYALTERA